MRYTYWDKVAVVDGELSDAFLSEAEHFLQSEFTQGCIKVGGDLDYKNNDYYRSKDTNVKDTPLIKKIISMGVVPIPDQYQAVAKLHRCLSGSQKESHLNWHSDEGYSIAITLYLTDVDGGELQIDNGDDQSILIKPKRGRLVLLKCETYHRVLPVKSGTRDSIQIFMRFE